MASDDKVKTVQSLERALDLIDSLSGNGNGCSIKELTEITGLNKTTVHRLLQTLRVHGYVTQNAETEKYLLGSKILELSANMLENLDLRQIAHPELELLCKQTQDTVHMSLLDDMHAVYVDKVDSTLRAYRMYSRIGKQIPLDCSSVGKTLIAWKNDDELKSVVHRLDYQKMTETTIVTPKDMYQELVDIREHGYAIDNFEHEDNIFCVAAPVFDRNHKVAAAVSVSTVAFSFEPGLIENVLQPLYNCVSVISKYLGCDSYPAFRRPSQRESIILSDFSRNKK